MVMSRTIQNAIVALDKSIRLNFDSLLTQTSHVASAERKFYFTEPVR